MAGVAIVIEIFMLMCFMFVLFLLLHGEHRQLLVIQLAASVILGHIPLAVISRPADTILWLWGESRSVGLCWTMEFIDVFTAVIIPYTLMMFTIERLMYIRNPAEHAQKITRAGAITLILFPWVISVVISTMKVGVIIGNEVDTNNTYLPVCNVKVYIHVYAIVEILLDEVIGGVLPMLINIIVTICVLVMWCCFKRKMSLGMDYTVMGEEIEATVRNSVIAVAILNALFIPMFIAEISVGSMILIEFGFLTAFGLFEGIMWICTLIPVRKKFVGLFRICCRKEPEQPSVQYSAESQKDVA